MYFDIARIVKTAQIDFSTADHRDAHYPKRYDRLEKSYMHLSLFSSPSLNTCTSYDLVVDSSYK